MATIQKITGKKGVTQYEMEQLLNLAERLQADSSKNKSQIGLNFWMIFGLVLALFGIIFLSLDMILKREIFISQIQTAHWIGLALLYIGYPLGMISLLRHRKKLANDGYLLRQDMDSIFDLIQESKMQYFRDLDPIERAAIEIRLRSLEFSEFKKDDFERASPHTFHTPTIRETLDRM